MPKFKNKENTSQSKRLSIYQQRIFPDSPIDFGVKQLPSVLILLILVSMLFLSGCMRNPAIMKNLQVPPTAGCQQATQLIELQKNKDTYQREIVLHKNFISDSSKRLGFRIGNLPSGVRVSVRSLPSIQNSNDGISLQLSQSKIQWLDRSITRTGRISIQIEDQLSDCKNCAIQLVMQKQQGISEFTKKISAVFAEEMTVLDSCFAKQKSANFGLYSWKSCLKKSTPLKSYNTIQSNLRTKYKQCGEGKELTSLIKAQEEVRIALILYGKSLWENDQFSYTSPKTLDDAVIAYIEESGKSVGVSPYAHMYQALRPYTHIVGQYELVNSLFLQVCGEDPSCLSDKKKSKNLETYLDWAELVLAQDSKSYQNRRISNNFPSFNSYGYIEKKDGAPTGIAIKKLDRFFEEMAGFSETIDSIQRGESFISIPGLEVDFERKWETPENGYSSGKNHLCSKDSKYPMQSKYAGSSYIKKILKKDAMGCCTNLRHLTKEQQKYVINSTKALSCSVIKASACSPCEKVPTPEDLEAEKIATDPMYKKMALQLLKTRIDEPLFAGCIESGDHSIEVLQSCLTSHKEYYLGCTTKNKNNIVAAINMFPNELPLVETLNSQIQNKVNAALNPFIQKHGIGEVGKTLQGVFAFSENQFGSKKTDDLHCFPGVKINSGIVDKWGVSCGRTNKKCTELNKILKNDPQGLSSKECVPKEERYPKSTLSISLPKQKRWKKFAKPFRCNQSKCITVNLSKDHFGGGKGVWIASKEKFKVGSTSAKKKSVLGYWKHSLPAYAWNGKLNANDNASVKICPTRSLQTFYVSLTPY